MGNCLYGSDLEMPGPASPSLVIQSQADGLVSVPPGQYDNSTALQNRQYSTTKQAIQNCRYGSDLGLVSPSLIIQSEAEGMSLLI